MEGEKFTVTIKGKKMVLKVYPDVNKSSKHARLFIAGKPKFERKKKAKKKASAKKRRRKKK